MEIPKTVVPQRVVVPAAFAGEPSSGNLTDADMKALLDQLLAAAPKEKPQFNVSDLMPQEPVPNLPLDLRPLAQFTDALYGTKTATNMPNYRAAALEEAQMRKALSGNQAVKQTEAQARLADFNQQLDAYYKARDPQALAKTLFDLKRAGTDQDAMKAMKNELSAFKLQTDIDQKMLAATNTIAKDKLDRVEKLSEKLAKEPSVTNYEKLRGSADRVRNAIYTSNESGVPQYGVVIDYIKTLDPPSTVMYSEAESLKRAQSMWQRLKNLPAQLESGQFLGPEAQRDMINMVQAYEDLGRQAFDRKVKEYGAKAKIQEIPEEAVTGPMQYVTEETPQTFTFTATKPDGTVGTFKVQSKRVEAFKAQHPDAVPVRLKP